MARTSLPENAAERAHAKATLHGQQAPGAGASWSRDGLTVTLDTAPTVDAAGALVVDQVTVTVDGQPVDVTASLPWRFVNPPLLRPDRGAGDQAHQAHRRPHDRRLREDPAAVLGIMLLDTAERVV